MKKKILFFLLLLTLFGCKKETDNSLEKTSEKALKKTKNTFKEVDKAWILYNEPITEASEKAMITWSDWREFIKELEQKPQTTLDAFQKKATILAKKSMLLNNIIPEPYNTPQIKCRIATLATQMGLLDMYLNSNVIDSKKIKIVVDNVNIELISLQRQMQKIEDKSKIPVEAGEENVLKMKDATRAIPNE